MTNKRQEPTGANGQFKQIYYKNNVIAPYTDARVSESDYLQTEVWKELRRARMEKDGYQCKKCGTGMNLVVHHITYPDIWGTESVDDDLITLCARCHAEIHKNDINKEVSH